MIHTRYGPFGGYTEPQVPIEEVVTRLRLLAKTLTPGCFFDKHTVSWARDLERAVIEHYGFAIDSHGEVEPDSDDSIASRLLQTSSLLRKVGPGLKSDRDLKSELLDKADVLEAIQSTERPGNPPNERTKTRSDGGSKPDDTEAMDKERPLRVEGVEAFCGDSHMDIPTGKAMKVFKILLSNLDRVTTYKELGCEGVKPKEADDQTRQAKAKIDYALRKVKAPYEIKTLRREGYRLQRKAGHPRKSG